MKIKLLVLFTLCLSLHSFSQTRYNVSYSFNSGNPGGLNTDTTDNVTAGWSPMIGAALATNQWSASLTLPFTFEFFGRTMTSLKASANGLISFAANPSLPDNNADLPSAVLPDSTIACFWDAFTNTPPTANNDSVIWKVFGSAPNRQLWIKWVSFEAGAPSVNGVTYSCVLEETTNNIYMVESEFSVNISTSLTSVTTGLQLNGTTAKQYDNKYRQRPANLLTPADNNYILFAPYTATNMAVSSALCSQPVLGKVPKNTVNNPILRVKVSTNGELNPLALSQLSFNTNGTIITSDITAAKVFYTGSDSSFNSLNQFGSTTTTPAGAFTVSGTQTLAKGDNYFWLTYNIAMFPSFAVVDAECAQVTVNSTPVVTTDPAPAGTRQIGSGLSGLISVGSGGTYNLLSEAFKAVNEEGLSDHLNISVISDITDTGTAVLNYVNENSFNITLTPSNNTVKNIVARIKGTYIDFSGTKNFSINGNDPLSASGKYLRFINQSDSGATIRFSNGASADTIQNCIIEGAARLQTMGLVHIAASQNTVPNHHLVIQNNDIRDRSDSVSIPAILVYTKGSADAKNHHNSILNNNLFNYMRSGVYVDAIGNGGDWKINGNSFYYNAATQPLAGDHVSIMLNAGPLSDNNQVHNNYIGGTAATCGGSAWVNNRGVNFVAMNINTGVATGTSVQGNVIQNINMTASTASLAWIGIRIESGRAEVGNTSGNLVGHLSTANSVISNLPITVGIYGFAQGNSEVIVANNTISNIFHSNTTTTSGFRGISFQLGAASPYIVNNTVSNITSAGTINSQTTSVLAAIAVVSGSNLGTVYIGRNKLFNLTSTAITGTVSPTAIAIDNGSSNGIIENNTIYNIFGNSSAGNIHGLYIQGGVKDWIVRNNMMAITNGASSVPMTVRGMTEAVSANVVTYLNNTIYIGGTSSGAVNSFAYERRSASGIPKLMNNIFYNERTGGTGVHAAIANIAAAGNWTPSTSGYNLLVSASPNTIGAWTATPTAQSFGQWQNSSAGDKTSWSDTAANIPASTFFKGLATGDLSIDTAVALCWYANGKGIALAANSKDKDDQPRSVTIAGGATDIGADEFTTLTPPIMAQASGNIAAGDSTLFTFAGRPVAAIYWRTAVLFPSLVNCRYYSGNYPATPGQTGATLNNFIQLVPTGGFGYDVDVKQYYDSAQFGTVSNVSNLIAIHNTGTQWFARTTALNTTTRSFTCTVQELGLFSGSDATNPVPVKLLAFTGRNSNGNAELSWATASEKNTSRFEVEVGVSNTGFEKAGTVKAIGNSTWLTNYSFVDESAFEKHNARKLYYRLKMIDNNGKFEYSNVIAIDNKLGAVVKAELYPNPFTSETKLVVNSTNESNARVMVADVHGKLIADETVSLTKGINAIMPASLLSAGQGIYFISLTIDGESQTMKLVK